MAGTTHCPCCSSPRTLPGPAPSRSLSAGSVMLRVPPSPSPFLRCSDSTFQRDMSTCVPKESSRETPTASTSDLACSRCARPQRQPHFPAQALPAAQAAPCRRLSAPALPHTPGLAQPLHHPNADTPDGTRSFLVTPVIVRVPRAPTATTPCSPARIPQYLLKPPLTGCR